MKTKSTKNQFDSVYVDIYPGNAYGCDGLYLQFGDYYCFIGSGYRAEDLADIRTAARNFRAAAEWLETHGAAYLKEAGK